MEPLRPIAPPLREPGLLVAFSERGETRDLESPTSVLARRLADTLGFPDLPIARATQVHGIDASVVESAPGRGEILDVGEADILFTRQQNLGLVVQTADCLPILIAGDGAIAAVHAGWRGMARDAAGSAIRALSAAGVPASGLRVWVGPSIGSCCYEVGGEVAAQFAGAFARASCGGRYQLDLRGAARAHLEAAGVAAGNIFLHPACTRCGGPLSASYRRDGAAAGRMIALIARLT